MNKLVLKHYDIKGIKVDLKSSKKKPNYKSISSADMVKLENSLSNRENTFKDKYTITKYYFYTDPYDLIIKRYFDGDMYNKKERDIFEYLTRKYNNITFYDPFFHPMFSYYEVLHHTKYLAKVNKPIKIASLGFHAGVLEAVIHYRERYSNEYHNDKYTHILSLLNPDDFDYEISKKILSKFIKTYNVEYSISETDKFYLNSLPSLKKKIALFDEPVDLVCISLRRGGGNMLNYGKIDTEIYMSQAFFDTIYFASQVSKIGANLYLVVRTIYSKPFSEIIYLLTGLYEKVEIIKTEIKKNMSNFTHIACYNFKGIDKKLTGQMEDIVQQWAKIDSSNGFDPKKYVTSILKKDPPYQFYTQLEKFNHRHIRDFSDQVDHIVHLYNLLTVSETDDVDMRCDTGDGKFGMAIQNCGLLREIRQGQLRTALDWCYRYDVPVKQKYLETTKGYLRRMYRNHFTIFHMRTFEFTYYEDDLLPKTIEYGKENVFFWDEMKKMERSLNFYRRAAYDTRDAARIFGPSGYGGLEDQLYLHKTTRKYLQEKFDIKPRPSKAWLKLYEMITAFELIPKKNSINTFHFAEAPGHFILSTNQYIQHHKLGKFNWYASSLNPFEEKNKELEPLGDYYQLIRMNKDRWIWGGDNTGNLYHPNVIRGFKEELDNLLKNKKLDFITSDAGIDLHEQYNLQETLNGMLTFSQILTILYLLPEGRAAIFKAYMPLAEAGNVSLFYLLYCVFDQLIVCNPVSGNPTNGEVYVVCKGYKGLSDKYIDRLFEIMPEYNVKKSLFKKEEIPETFLLQMENMSSLFIKDTITNINRTVNYYEDRKYLKSADKVLIEKLRRQRNKEWVKRYPIGKISSSNRLKAGKFKK